MTQYLDLEVFALELEAIGYKVRDYGLLSAALERPKTTAFGKDAYQSLDLKAAALVHSLIQNHPIFDGNKRVAWLGLNAFLYINGYKLNCREVDAYSMILGIAKDKFELDEIATWVKRHRIRSKTD